MASKEEIEAVKKTRDQWQWLADNPDKQKSDYYEMTKEWPRGLTHCFLCDVFWGCEGCPLDTWILTCDKITSPYVLWVKKVFISLNALRIVRACNRWLKKHEKD